MLMDENRQPSVTRELGRAFPSIRGRGGRSERSECLRVGAGEYLLQQLVQIIPVLQHGLPQNGRLKK